MPVDAHVLAIFGVGMLDSIMQQLAFHRIAALRPETFDVNQSTLARTIQAMLQRGDGDQIVIVHVVCSVKGRDGAPPEIGNGSITEDPSHPREI